MHRARRKTGARSERAAIHELGKAAKIVCVKIHVSKKKKKNVNPQVISIELDWAQKGVK